jgi:hypothetical protein
VERGSTLPRLKEQASSCFSSNPLKGGSRRVMGLQAPSDSWDKTELVAGALSGKPTFVLVIGRIYYLKFLILLYKESVRKDWNMVSWVLIYLSTNKLV